jgi:hypothetical protein
MHEELRRVFHPLIQNPIVLQSGHLAFEPELQIETATRLADAYAAIHGLEWSATAPGWYSDTSVRVKFWPLKDRIIRD